MRADVRDKHGGDRGVRASHVAWAVAVKLLHSFPLSTSAEEFGLTLSPGRSGLFKGPSGGSEGSR